MKNKGIIALVILLLAILALVFAYSFGEIDDSANKTSITVSSEGPIALSDVIDDIKTGSYYDGYDNETISRCALCPVWPFDGVFYGPVSAG